MAHPPVPSPPPWSRGTNPRRQQAEAAPAAQPQEGTEVSTHTAYDKPAEAKTRPATQWIKGAATAHDLIIRQIEAGQDADTIAAKWDQALATYDDATATDPQQQWHAGAEETARDMIQTWREMQRAEAEQRQADRDAKHDRQAGPEHELEAG
jgi:hypothetical protein